jgi:hypothetical protein
VERAESETGPWVQVGYNISDAEDPYFPLFHDCSAHIGKTYYYRVKAVNELGISEPSNVAGPVSILAQAIIDPMQNYGVLYSSNGVHALTGNDRDYKEIIHRLHGEKDAEIIYNVPGTLEEFRVFAFEKDQATSLEIHGSFNGRSWEPLDLVPSSYVNAETNYNYLVPKIYSGRDVREFKFLKISFLGQADLARCEIVYNSGTQP